MVSMTCTRKKIAFHKDNDQAGCKCLGSKQGLLESSLQLWSESPCPLGLYRHPPSQAKIRTWNRKYRKWPQFGLRCWGSFGHIPLSTCRQGTWQCLVLGQGQLLLTLWFDLKLLWLFLPSLKRSLASLTDGFWIGPAKPDPIRSVIVKQEWLWPSWLLQC